MTRVQKIQNAFQLVAMIHRLQATANEIASLIEQPDFDPQARLIVDELLSAKPGHFAMACGVAVGEIRGPADKLAREMEIGANMVANGVAPSARVRPLEWDEVIATPIVSIEQAKAFIRYLSQSGLMFHFEDSIESIVCHSPGDEQARRTFVDAEVAPLSARVAELYSFAWGEHQCPIGYALDYERGGPEWRKE